MVNPATTFSISGLYSNLLDDLGLKDKRIRYQILSRIKAEGLGFITVALPSIHDAFLSMLENGFSKSIWQRKMAGFLSWTSPFGRRVRAVLEDPTPEGVWTVRQLCLLSKKLEVKDEDRVNFLEQKALLDFTHNEEIIEKFDNPRNPEFSKRESWGYWMRLALQALFPECFESKGIKLKDGSFYSEFSWKKDHISRGCISRFVGRYPGLFDGPGTCSTLLPEDTYGSIEPFAISKPDEFRELKDLRNRINTKSIKHGFLTPSQSLIDWHSHHYYGTEKDNLFPDSHISEFLTVPKDTRKRRTILRMPISYLRNQFLLHEYTRKALVKKLPLNDLKDQTIQQKRCLEASKNGRYATMDLSSASDLISDKFLRELLKGTTFGLLYDWTRMDKCALPADQSTPNSVPLFTVNSLAPAWKLVGREIKLVYGRHNYKRVLKKVVPLKKAFGMGFYGCMPIMMLYFLLLYCAVRIIHTLEILQRRNITLDPKGFDDVVKKICNKASKEFSCYGDDLIFSKRFFSKYSKALEDVGSIPNLNKSFHRSRFRESCGVDAYNGFDVSVSKVQGVTLERCPYSSDKLNVAHDQVPVFIAGCRNLYDNGLLQTAKYLIGDRICYSSLEDDISFFPGRGTVKGKLKNRPFKTKSDTKLIKNPLLSDALLYERWLMEHSDGPYNRSNIHESGFAPFTEKWKDGLQFRKIDGIINPNYSVNDVYGSKLIINHKSYSVQMQ